MSEELTKNIPDGRSFQERVFARFDSLDARLQALERQAERRAMETKPIWERALAEILEVRGDVANVREDIASVRESVANVERKIDVLSRDIIQVRADQSRVENRIDKLESSPSS